jgi:hypothetical protein
MAGMRPFPGGPGTSPELAEIEAVLRPVRQFRWHPLPFRDSGFHYQLLDESKKLLLDVEPLTVGRWSLSASSGYPLHSHGEYRILGPGGAVLGSIRREVTMTAPDGTPVQSIPLFPYALPSTPPRGVRHTLFTLCGATGSPLMTVTTAAGVPLSPYYPLEDEGCHTPTGTLWSHSDPQTLPVVQVPRYISVLNAAGGTLMESVHVGFGGLTFDATMAGGSPAAAPLLHLLALLLELRALETLGASIYLGQESLWYLIPQDTQPQADAR